MLRELEHKNVQSAWPLKDNVWAEFANQSEKPPANDPYIRACYSAVAGPLGSNPDFVRLVDDVLKHRPDITPSHFVNLFLRSVQFVELFDREDASYPQAYKDAASWDILVSGMLKNKTEAKHLTTMMRERDTGTTIYGRYSGINALLAQNPNKAWNVLDIGSGGNHGLKGIALGEEFAPVKFEGGVGERMNQLISTKVRIHEGLAVDKHNADDPDIQKWRMACSFYPSELHKRAEVEAFESRIVHAKQVEFIERNILDDKLPLAKFDVATICTMLYMMPEMQKEVYKVARDCLKPGGSLVVQDFAVKNPSAPQSLTFTGNWGEKFGYRMFVANQKSNWEFRECLKWLNGRCMEARMGEDCPDVRAFCDIL